MRRLFFLLLLLCMLPVRGQPGTSVWGFFMHRQINRTAVFTLPPEMIVFYKHHLAELVETAVDPDRRRYVMEAEAPRHYIDLDHYPAHDSLRISWLEACEKYTEDTLIARGIVPWHADRLRRRLTDAFRLKDGNAILRISSDLGHYIGDAHVPLHTTSNYDGEATGQEGIHGLWETRLPELYFEEYDAFTGKAGYLDDPLQAIWEAVIQAHDLVDSVLLLENEVQHELGEDASGGFGIRGQQMVRVYNRNFARTYHRRLQGMVERQFRNSVRLVGSFWYSSWVDAGQPDLKDCPIIPWTHSEWKVKYDSLHKADSLRFSADLHLKNTD